MKKNFLSLIFLLFVIELSAQNALAKIEFDLTEHDFDKINEDDGIAEFEFKYANIGNIPLILNEVKASCGCTKPEWSDKPVLPGQKSSIKIGYNPKGRPGNFSKTITIKSNAQNSPVVLTIKGYVLTEKIEVSDYKFSIGELKVSNLHATYGTILKGEKKVRIIEYSNSSDESLKLEFKEIPGYVQAKFEPNIVLPGKTGRLIITYNSNDIDDWDYIINRLKLMINKKEYPNNEIIVSAVITEDFSNLTLEQIDNAPIVSIENDKYIFGSVKQGNKVDYNYKISNTGKSDLIIRKVRASCGCTVVKPEKNTVPAGGSTFIKASFNSTGKKGDQKFAITLITNDPVNYKKLLFLEGDVVTE